MYALLTVAGSDPNHYYESHQEAPLSRSALRHVGDISPGKET